MVSLEYSNRLASAGILMLVILQLISLTMAKPIAEKKTLNRQKRQWGSTCSFWRWSMCRGKKEVEAVPSSTAITITEIGRIAEGPNPIITNDKEFKAAYANPLPVETAIITEKRRTSSHPYEHSYVNGITVKERILMRVLKTLWQAANSQNTDTINLATTKTNDHTTEKQEETNSIERINHRIDEEVSTEIESSKQTHVEEHRHQQNMGENLEKHFSDVTSN